MPKYIEIGPVISDKKILFFLLVPMATRIQYGFQIFEQFLVSTTQESILCNLAKTSSVV